MIALHGFLGRPSDWSMFDKGCFEAIDLFNFQTQLKLWQWGAAFNAYVDNLTTKQNILIGYSLGGRLALHALILNPSLWQRAIIISAHPGLSNSDEKQKRFEIDLTWAKRFREEPWDQLMADWNGREVFAKDSFSFDRQETHYKRDHLAQALINWSVGQQNDLKEAIQKLPIPILWIAGENDAKYKSLAQSLIFRNPQSKVWIAPQAGHRVPWEQPELFSDQVDSFIN